MTMRPDFKSNNQNYLNDHTHSSTRKIKRHSIELNPHRKREKTISFGFKIWAGAYALMMLAGLALTALPAQSQTASPAPQTAPLASSASNHITPGDMQAGGLLFRTKEAGQFIEAPKVATEFKIDVTGPVARATVIQKFLNPKDSWLEGIYVFPLPEDAAVDQLRMKVGDRIIEGIIKPKAEARKIYEDAKKEGKKASLLEQHRPNLFTNAVANIGPHESITVEIEYQQTIQRKDAEFSLRIPLVTAPRYNPAPDHLKPVIHHQTGQVKSGSGWSSNDPVPDRDTITAPVLDPDKHPKTNPVMITIALNAGFPLDEIKSHYHKVTIEQKNAQNATLTLAEEVVPADKDFLLTWTSKAGKAPKLGLFAQHRTNSTDPDKTGPDKTGPDNTDKTGAKATLKDDYLLAYITPPYKLTEALATPARDVTFVIDQSGSMAGESIIQAKASLQEALKQLKAKDYFQIIRFDDHMASLFPNSQPANKGTLALATSWVKAIEADGGTEMAPAMHAALKEEKPIPGTLRQVIFITDGAIGNETELFEIVKSEKGRSRIFTVGIGSAPNSFFMSRAAEVGRGTFTHIGNTTEVKKKMGQLFTQLSSPVATDLSLTLDGAQDAVAAPSVLPDLYLNEPLVVAIKAKDLGKTLTLTGRFDDQPWSISTPLANAASSSAIDKLWARRKIRQLEADRLLSNDYDTIDKQIETLGMNHHLITRLTSLVAVDVTPSRPDDEALDSKKVPLNLPDGWQYDQVFGDDMLEAQMAPMAASPAPAGTRSRLATKLAPMAGARPQMETAIRKPKPADQNTTPNTGMGSTGKESAIKDTSSNSLLMALGAALVLIIAALFVWLKERKQTPED